MLRSSQQSVKGAVRFRRQNDVNRNQVQTSRKNLHFNSKFRLTSVAVAANVTFSLHYWATIWTSLD